MADTDDALKHFMSSNDDPYQLLDLPNGPASTEKEIRSAWKRTALIFHPDKIRAKDNIDEATANQLYILRQDAYGVLSEPHLKEQYDNALRAKEQKKQRDAALTGKRKAMKDDLEMRENIAKRQKVDLDESERELERLRLDGQRRRRERAEMLRKQAEEEEREAQRERAEGAARQGEEASKENGAAQSQVQDIDRVVKLRFPKDETTAHLTRERVEKMFSRFGAIEAVTLRDKKIKVEGSKHRKVFMTVAVIFESIVGAHAAVSDFVEVAKDEKGDWTLIDEAPAWASGQEPRALSRSQQQQQYPVQPQQATNGDADDIMTIRLREAQKVRREEKIRREEAAAAAANGNGAAPDEPPKTSVPSFASFRAKAAAAPGSEDAEKKREEERKRLEEEMRREEQEEDRESAGHGVAV